jgi:hypothetical protein
MTYALLIGQAIIAGLLVLILLRLYRSENRDAKRSPADSGADLRAWIEMARGKSGADAAVLYDAAFDRYPASKELLDRIFAHYGRLAAESEDLQVRHAAIARLGNAAERFSARCARLDFETARLRLREVDSLSAQLIEVAERRQRESVAGKVGALEQAVSVLSAGSASADADLEQVAKLDGSINRDALRAYPDLATRYEGTSRRLVQLLQKGDPTKENRVDYNLRAVKAAREAWTLIQEHRAEGWLTDDSKDFNKAWHMTQLVQRLGGWDSNRLMPPSNTYIASVYAEVLQKLAPGMRADFTELMIRESTKA